MCVQINYTHADRVLCESMSEIRSITSEITFWKKKKKNKVQL